MRLLHHKSQPERLLDAGSDSLGSVLSGRHSGTLFKAALVAGGIAAITAGSAGISALRRRIEANS